MTRKKITKEEALSKLLSYKHNLEYPDFDSLYESSKSKIKAVCPVHGEFERRYDQFTSSSGCPSCSQSEKNSKYSQETIIDYINSAYPDVDTSKVIFKTVRDNITLIHPEHGEIERTPESILKSFSINFNGVRIKALEGSSIASGNIYNRVANKALKELESFIHSLGFTEEDYIKDYILKDNNVSYKVSFFFPSLNYAVNFNSAFQLHSSNTEYVDPKLIKNYKPKDYNYKLWKTFHDKGIIVFNIYDFYWVLEEKKPIILSKISHGLGKDKKVYARKCRVGIDEISITESKNLLNDWHIEGAGFYYKESRVFSLHDKDTNEPLMVAVVGKYFEQGSGDKFVNKLGRIATKRGITVVGGLSKLTKEIIKEYGNFHYLITLSSGGSSLSHSEGSRLIEPRYFWIDIKNPKLPFYHRNYCQKGVLEKHFGKPLWNVTEENGKIRQCTEREYMESLGFVRFFDNGLKEIFFGEEHIGSGVKDG